MSAPAPNKFVMVRGRKTCRDCGFTETASIHKLKRREADMSEEFKRPISMEEENGMSEDKLTEAFEELDYRQTAEGVRRLALELNDKLRQADRIGLRVDWTASVVKGTKQVEVERISRVEVY